jgi:hypothetical protein
MQLAYNNKGIHLTISIHCIYYSTEKVFMQKSPFSSEIIVIQSNSSNIQLVANLFISLNLNRRNIFKDSS